MIKFTSLNTATEDVNLVIEPTYYQYLLTELDFKIYFCNENVKNHITEDFFLKNSKSILNHRLNGSKYKSSKNENVVINFRNAQKKKDVIKGSGIYYNRFSFYIDQSEDYGDDEVVVHFSLLITTQLDISLIDIFKTLKSAFLFCSKPEWNFKFSTTAKKELTRTSKDDGPTYSREVEITYNKVSSKILSKDDVYTLKSAS